ncbi:MULTISPECIES: Hsp20/alpha crystallin family protein [unclassified Rhodococcus (in: high G+C Gram-positive bacteria)]|uniref:Hsp20/alpha crystallin family protein n=1 Tax=unclassified Rhodococcus (in: high G+C Gram-positive bacteria) TaxID=192944 RepID=UPI0005D939EA|nr:MULTISPECIES: Hsp20/alpha crystallin family protein [unclassified Rhodococcus (in: high G+C Gram-positive bacteria)]AJW40155.1 heat shock protein Hsp20 [Rhodococcus sp. B7740]
MTVLANRTPLIPSWPALPDWSDLMARFEAMPPWSALEGHMIRVEETLEDDRYVLRAELPGIDPERDVDISVHDGKLFIKAERAEQKTEGTRSEFRYGSFHRTIDLPAGAKDDAIEATYDNGILTVDVTLAGSEPDTPVRHIEVRSNGVQPNGVGTN